MSGDKDISTKHAHHAANPGTISPKKETFLSGSVVSRGVKNASYLAFGNLISQAIRFVGFIYIARLLGPNDYGIYVTVGAFVGAFNFLLLGGLDKTILREGSRDIPSMHVHLEKTIGLRNTLILLAIMVCIISTFFTPYTFQVKMYIVIFSSDLAFMGLRGLLGTVYQATEKMQYLSILGVFNSLIFVVMSVVFLYNGYGLLALFLITLFSHFLTIALNYIFSRRFVKFKFFSRVQFDKNLMKPALVFSLLGFITFFILKVDTLMISFLGNAKDVGIYAVASKITQQGEMLRGVTSTAFFPIFIKRFSDGNVDTKTFVRYSLFFLCAILMLSLIASFFAKDVIVLLFGSKYGESGDILRTLIFYLAFTWASLPSTLMLQATYNEKYLMAPVVISGALNVLLNYMFFMRYGLIGIAYSTLVVSAVYTFLYIVICYKTLKKQNYLV